MESVHYLSKAHRTSLVADTQSDVDPDGVALESDISGPVRLSVTAAEKLESLPQELAAPPSAPVQGVDGGIGSESVLQAGVSLSAPGGHIDPLTRVHSSTNRSTIQFSPTVASPVVRCRTPLLSESTRRCPRPGARRRRDHGRRLETLH